MTVEGPQQPVDAGSAEGDATWVRVARSGQVPEGYVRRFFADGIELAVARLDGSVYAMSNYCTHLDCLLSSGKLVDDGIRCSCHGSVFDLQSGEPIYPPATVPIKTYATRESGEEIFVAITAADREHSGRRRSFRASDIKAPYRAP